jgi:hypothetical protein
VTTFAARSRNGVTPTGAQATTSSSDSERAESRLDAAHGRRRGGGKRPRRGRRRGRNLHWTDAAPAKSTERWRRPAALPRRSPAERSAAVWVAPF